MRVEVYGCKGNIIGFLVFVENFVCFSRVSLISDVFLERTLSVFYFFFFQKKNIYIYSIYIYISFRDPQCPLFMLSLFVVSLLTISFWRSLSIFLLFFRILRIKLGLVQGLSQAAPLHQSRSAIGIAPLKNGQGDNLSPSKFREKTRKKHTRRDLFRYRSCKLKQNVESIFYRTFKVARLEFLGLIPPKFEH